EPLTVVPMELGKLLLAFAVETFLDQQMRLAARVAIDVFGECQPWVASFAVLFLHFVRRQPKFFPHIITLLHRILPGERVDHETFRRVRIKQYAQRVIGSAMPGPRRAYVIAAHRAAEYLGNLLDGWQTGGHSRDP